MKVNVILETCENDISIHKMVLISNDPNYPQELVKIAIPGQEVLTLSIKELRAALIAVSTAL